MSWPLALLPSPSAGKSFVLMFWNKAQRAFIRLTQTKDVCVRLSLCATKVPHTQFCWVLLNRPHFFLFFEPGYDVRPSSWGVTKRFQKILIWFFQEICENIMKFGLQPRHYSVYLAGPSYRSFRAVSDAHYMKNEYKGSTEIPEALNRGGEWVISYPVVSEWGFDKSNP